jgi:6-phosphogluconolactonase
MKQIKISMIAMASLFFLYSCNKEIKPISPEQSVSVKNESANAQARSAAVGYVYTASNQTSANRVLVYSRTVGGELTYVNSYATGGTGTGGGLGNQGAVTLSDDNEMLLVVNAGSNSVTSFTVSGASLQWKSTVPSGGTGPVSVTVHHDLVYVLNAGGSGNMSGFRLHDDGTLHPIAGSSKPLSSSTAGAAQVSFVADGYVLAITEKATNKIVTYTIDAMGKPDMMHSINSSTPTPFGFAVGKENIIYVSEAAGGAAGASNISSYLVHHDGMIELVEGSVGAGQSAACWVVITNNGKYIYDTNTGSGNLSSFITDHGDLTVLEAIAGVTGGGSSPIDAALSVNSKFLYVLNTGNNTISVFEVDNDGSLNNIQTLQGVPAGATGMAAK